MKWQKILSLVPAPGGVVDFQGCLEAFPVLEHAKTTPQGVYHLEGDVWTHTKMVVKELVNHADYLAANDVERTTVFFAALLHDVAKYSTTVIDPLTGAIGQPGHSRRGAIDVRIALWDMEAPFAVREHICRLIAVHQVPFFAFEGGPGKPTAEFTARKFSWCLSMKLLTMLAEADMRGRICPDQQKVLDAIELFREVARIDDCYDKPKAFSTPHTAMSYFRGASVDPSFELHQNMGSRVIVMSGLPASGKNTWVSAHCKELPVVSFDDARDELKLKHGENEGKAASAAIEKAKHLLRSKSSFVWNATHLSPQMRAKSLDLLFAYDAQVHLVYLESSRKTIYSRNNKRDTSLKNSSIEKMLFKWEVPLPTEAHEVNYQHVS